VKVLMQYLSSVDICDWRCNVSCYRTRQQTVICLLWWQLNYWNLLENAIIYTFFLRSLSAYNVITAQSVDNTCQTVYPQFLQPVADTHWGLLAQRLTFCQEQELDLENIAFSTPVQPPGTLYHPTFTTLLIPFIIIIITEIFTVA